MPEEPNAEDIPIEYYELREIAKRRVMLKSSLQAHFLVYVIMNSIFIYLNIYFWNPEIVVSPYRAWAIWPVILWGLVLWSHLLEYLTDKITDQRKKRLIFMIFLFVYLNPILIYLNSYANDLVLRNPLKFENFDVVIWWPWSLALTIITVIIYALLLYFKNKSNFEKKIKDEMIRLTKSQQ